MSCRRRIVKPVAAETESSSANANAVPFARNHVGEPSRGYAARDRRNKWTEYRLAEASRMEQRSCLESGREELKHRFQKGGRSRAVPGKARRVRIFARYAARRKGPKITSRVVTGWKRRLANSRLGGQAHGAKNEPDRLG